MARHRPPVAETRRLTKEELTRLGFSPGSKRHVAADIKRVTKRTRTWSERQAVQARKGMTKEAYTKGVQRGEFAYSERNRQASTARRIRSKDKQARPRNDARRTAVSCSRRATHTWQDGKLSPEQKDKWKSVFARYPKNSLMELFGYPAAPPAAFPFVLAA